MSKPREPHRFGGRSLLGGDLTLADIESQLKRFGGTDLFSAEMMDGCVHDVLLVEGNLEVAADLVTFKENLCGLIVLGDLSVSGQYEDSDDPNTGVYVAGSLRAKNAITSGELVVLGDLDIAGTLVGDHNDFGARIGGKAEAKLFVPEEHAFDFGGKASFGHVLGDGGQCTWKGKKPWQELAVTQYPRALVKEVLIEDLESFADLESSEVLDHDALKARVRKGQPVLRR